MAITKILHIGEGKRWTGKHLKTAISYIAAPEKTGGGRYVSGVGCQPAFAYEQMRETKELFSKTDKRQAYHIIISFEEGEITAERAFEFLGRFVKEYLQDEYEAVYAVHDNTEHVHGHIIFNSVSRITGLKYRYKKGDWARYMQPVTNRLCEEYGLSTIVIDEEDRESGEPYKEWRDGRAQENIWSDLIRRDFDSAILQATTSERFYQILTEKGYEFKTGKYLSIRPPGMSRFRRCRSLGEQYSEEAIQRRIRMETMDSMYRQGAAHVVRIRVPYYLKRAKLSGLQRKYFRKLYRSGRLRKRPYSQVWTDRNLVRQFYKHQDQYLFLSDHGIQTREDFTAVMDSLEERKKELNREKSQLYRKKAKLKPLMDIVERMGELEPAEQSFRDGDEFFLDEHREYESLAESLHAQGYSSGEVVSLQEWYLSEGMRLKDEYGKVAKEIKTAKELLAEVDAEREIEAPEKTREQEQKQNQERKPGRPR